MKAPARTLWEIPLGPLEHSGKMAYSIIKPACWVCACVSYSTFSWSQCMKPGRHCCHLLCSERLAEGLRAGVSTLYRLAPPPPVFFPLWYPTGPQPLWGAPGAGIKTGRHGRILRTTLWWCHRLFNLLSGNSCWAKASWSSLPAASLRRDKQI